MIKQIIVNNTFRHVSRINDIICYRENSHTTKLLGKVYIDGKMEGMKSYRYFLKLSYLLNFV